MEISKCGLYCGQCKDFVYDRDFDGIHNGEVLRNSEIISMVQGTKQSAYLIINDKIKNNSECFADIFIIFTLQNQVKSDLDSPNGMQETRKLRSSRRDRNCRRAKVRPSIISTMFLC